jgi:hypothetical protein
VNPVRLRLIGFDGRERPYRLRMPFRFGVTTATHGRQALLHARVRMEDGREFEGYAAEALGAKWFDKNLALTDDQNHHQLRKSLELAAGAYLSAGEGTPFGLFAELNGPHVSACADIGLNPLIASYGQSLVDRAILDAVCRGLGISFYTAMAHNLVGLQRHEIAPELDGMEIGSMFRNAVPARDIHVRHTVGLVDPVLATDIAPADRVDDGLPETLEEVVATYGNRYFKLKLGGDEAADLDRLVRIASVLDRLPEPYMATLDGNEQYADADSIAGFYRRLAAEPRLARLAASIFYVEQPIHRGEALTRPVTALARHVPVIIDESDGTLSAFAEARALGYAGVSSKACKGIYKSIVNHGRCLMWNAGGERRHFMSAEDLTCEPGIAIQQDLALVNLLGLGHVERNAHHFIDGFGDRPEHEAAAFLAAHPDLYHRQGGRIRLAIRDGKFGIGSLDCAGFGAVPTPELSATEPMPAAQWPVCRGDRDARRL